MEHYLTLEMVSSAVMIVAPYLIDSIIPDVIWSSALDAAIKLYPVGVKQIPRWTVSVAVQPPNLELSAGGRHTGSTFTRPHLIHIYLDIADSFLGRVRVCGGEV